MQTPRAFTLIELLVVIAIIGVLASVVLVSLNSARSKARDARRLSDMHSLVTALELYASDHNGSYPNTGAGSWAYSGSGSTWIPGLSPTYIPTVPQDPINAASPEEWYYYTSNGTDYCIQISQENDCASSPYYWGVWSGTCKLRTGTTRTYCY
ncbi:MAG TPA: type II secretion system protein [Candidatus Paceibacterota bacterium]|nr:type II secretion system protein [Candidatus Paceibacterota bacterium]